MMEAVEEVEADHHPSAPHDELFDVSTTIDPSYIISIIRSLLPSNIITEHPQFEEVPASNTTIQRSNIPKMEEGATSTYENGDLTTPNNKGGPIDSLNEFGSLSNQEKMSIKSCLRSEHSNALIGDQVWEERGCFLWDLAASKTHAEFMVQNYLLDVLLINLTVSESPRNKEIVLGILGNLACHDFPMRQILTIDGLIDKIFDQMFIDDTPCLSETCRLLTLGLQSCEAIMWAKAMQSEEILRRLLWFAENTLNLQLIEKSVGLLFAIIESELKVARAILANLINLGLTTLLINLLSLEVRKLIDDRIPERYSVIDLILRALETLSTIDDYSKEICLNEELFKSVYDLLRLPDKADVSDCCVTAVVLLANILTEAPSLASNLSQDVAILEDLIHVLSFASDDLEARGAVWDIMAELLSRTNEKKISGSSLHQYVSILLRNSELIEDELLNIPIDHSNEHHSYARNVALREIVRILNRRLCSEDQLEEKFIENDAADEVSIVKLLDLCYNHIS